jgi:hypothetical protein
MKFNKALLLTILLLSLLAGILSRKAKRSHHHHTLRKVHHKSHAKLNFLPVVAHALAYKDNDVDIKSYFTKHKEFAGTSNDIIGFTGYTEFNGKKYVVVFIRGTKTFSNLMTDIKYASEDLGKGMGACTNCKIHGGFWKAYKNLKVPLFESFESMMEDVKTVDHVIFTGHSLGGAMANLATYTYFNRRDYYAKLENLKAKGGKYYNTNDVSLVTFGAPRVGNKSFAQFINKLVTDKKLTRNYRVVYNDDPISTIPPKSIKDHVLWGAELEFEHAGTLIFYNAIKLDTISGKSGKDKEDELKRLFNISPSKMGADNVDDSANHGAMQVIWSFTDIGEHSFYKYLDGEKLWKFIVDSENLKKN